MANRHFTTIVVGENPTDLLSKYDANKKVEPFVVYSFAKIQQYYDTYVKTYSLATENTDIPETVRDDYRIELERLKSMTPMDLYIELTEDYDIDETTGDAMTDMNPDGKYHICRLGDKLSMPLVDLNGDAVFQARKKDVNWSIVHLFNTETYECIWEMVMEGRKPSTEKEREYYENMKNRIEYFQQIGSKERYVKHHTAFWGYAFLDENGWIEMDDVVDPYEWVSGFYDRFIKNLDENALISVYECIRN